ncbi:hypothetical protein EDD21DRAFT_364911 [Dissophora ornata]|nr:hypothetical protein EDD21DRAFT_364911 [Dissophora ornata]
MPSSAQEPSSYGFFGANDSSSPPMTMPTPTPRAHHSHGQPSRRPASMYSVGTYGHLHQSQQFPQKPGQFQPQHPSSSASSTSAAHYGPSGTHSHNGGHGHSNSFSHPAGPYGMDIILPANSSTSASSSSSQRPVLPPPITTVPPRRQGQSMEEYEDSRRAHRHERTLSEGHPAGYTSPTSVSPVSPSDRHMDTQYRDEHEEDSPTSATQSSPFANGGNNNGGSTTSNRNSTSLASFGLKAMSKDRSEEAEPSVIPRERSLASAYYNNPAQAAKNRRSYDDALYDEDQQLMRDSFNMDTRLVISEDEPRPESAIDLLAYAAAFVQESEEHNKDGKDAEEKRDGLGHLSSSNKRQSFHGPTGYPSKEPFQDDSSRYSSGGMAWEASSPAGSNNDVMPVPRRRGGDDAPYAPRRPRPVTYGGSGNMYDHQESQFLPQSPSSSLGSYGRPISSAGARRSSNRNSTEVGSSGLLLQRGLTRPRRSSSTAVSGMMSHMSVSSMTVLPPIINENRLLSPAMVPSPQFGASRLTRQDSQGNTNSGGMNGSGGGATRESPGSDSYSYNESHTSRDDMEDIEDEQTEYERQRAAKRRSGTANSFFGMGVK